MSIVIYCRVEATQLRKKMSSCQVVTAKGNNERFFVAGENELRISVNCICGQIFVNDGLFVIYLYL